MSFKFSSLFSLLFVQVIINCFWILIIYNWLCNMFLSYLFGPQFNFRWNIEFSWKNTGTVPTSVSTSIWCPHLTLWKIEKIRILNVLQNLRVGQALYILHNSSCSVGYKRMSNHWVICCGFDKDTRLCPWLFWLHVRG